MTVHKLPTRFRRPCPPADLLEPGGAWFAPAPEVLDWLQGAIVDEDGPLHNEDHSHLAGADLVVLWAAGPNERRGRRIIGEAEQVMFRCSGWQRQRQEEQMQAWFGRVPAFVITLDAQFCGQCSDREFAALVEHELYHITQATDPFGMPRFTKAGLPALCLRGHDVEEFVGVVARYGASAEVARMVEAAKGGPAVSAAAISAACGTCARKAA